MVLKGDPSLEHSQISLKSMIRMIKKEGGGMLVELRQIEPEKKVEVEVSNSTP